jgi:hypothetical protein
VKVVFKQNPLPMHDNAVIAAEAALAANAQNKFWEMHDKMFENMRALTRPDLERYAQEIGLDMERFKRSMDGHEFQAAIEADQAIAAQLGARGTPSFFINGRPLRGAQPFEGFKTVIDEELQNAQRLASSGVPRARLYAEITKNGLTKAAAAPPRPDRPDRPREDPNKIYAIADNPRAPFKGGRNARVVIQEFSDFQ